jgi:hypothetical protein
MYYDYKSPPLRRHLLIAPLHFPQLLIFHHTDHSLAVGNQHQISNPDFKLALLLKQLKLGVGGAAALVPSAAAFAIATLAAAVASFALITSPIMFVDAKISRLILLITSMLSMQWGQRITAALASSTTMGWPTPGVAALVTKHCAATAASCTAY